MNGPQESAVDSYFQQCKSCGQAIQMRQMPAGQWVAFDDVERVHDCRNQSAYNDLYVEATRTLALSISPAPGTPTPADSLPTTTPIVVAPRPPASTPETQGTAASQRRASPLVWVVGLLLLLSVGGWLTSARLSLRPLGTAQATPAAQENVRADDPAEPAPPAPAPASTPSSTEGSREPATLVDRQSFDFIYVRSGPDVAYPEIARVYGASTPFEPQGRSESGEWIFGTFEDGTEGWVKAEFVLGEGALDGLPLQANEQPEGVAARIDLQEYDFIYVQQGPGVDFDEVRRLEEPGTPFEAIARSTDSKWIFVQLEDGTPGWIMRDFVLSDVSLDLLPAYESRTIGAQ
jgi:hypothetical protein